MSVTIGALAHVDAGKTSFSEQLLFHTNAIRNRGRVDHKSSFMDNDDIEKERGITIFSQQANFSVGNRNYCLIDNPGHVDFSAEMERNVKIIDYALIIISAVEGVQGHTHTIWNLLQKHNIPVIFFVNKIDRVGADINAVRKQIEESFSENTVVITDNLDADSFIMNEELIEDLAEKNDSLMERYFDSGYDKDLWEKALCDMTTNRDVFPIFYGSALLDEGVEFFVNCLNHVTTDNYTSLENEYFSAKVYKIKYDDNYNRQVFLKVLSGSLKVKDEISYSFKGETVTQKVNEIRIYNSGKYKNVNHVTAGEVCAVTGLSDIACGAGIGENAKTSIFYTPPTLTANVNFDDKISIKTVLEKLRILEDEDPMLMVKFSEELNEISVCIMGEIQISVLTTVLKNRFDLDVVFGECKILYRETVLEPIVGFGHFEPLRHYAEVHIRLEPNKRGTGNTFSSDCHVDTLSLNYQNLVKTHVFEKDHKGVLIGASVTDINFCLVVGRAHLKHTEGGDFREATYRCIRHALMYAKSVLLEPFYSFKLDVPIDNLGRAISDIQKLHGEFDSPVLTQTRAIINGVAPVSTFLNYPKEVMVYSKGQGSISLQFLDYRPCHNQEEVVEKANYFPDNDVANTADSVFCSHGAGFAVKYYDVKNYIHCK